MGPSVIESSRDRKDDASVDWKLELVVVPVADVDRAKTFYAETVGFNVDVDHRAGDNFRVVQLTPRGRLLSNEVFEKFIRVPEPVAADFRR